MFTRHVKWYFVFGIFICIFWADTALCSRTIPSKCLDEAFAYDAYYRKDSWQTKHYDEENPFHKDLAYNVVCAHELCEDLSSNVAAFGFSISLPNKRQDYVHFPLLLSSGKLVSNLPRTLNVCSLEDYFSKRFDISTPTEQLNKFANFVYTTLDLKFARLDEVSKGLSQKTSTLISLASHVLQLVPDELDVNLGYIKHCEQCFIFELFRNPGLVEETVNKLIEKANIEPSVSKIAISLDIITYNDMCQRCFAACDCYFTTLEKQVEEIVKKKYKDANVTFNIYVSSFRPFEINISKGKTAGFTRGTQKQKKFDKFFQTAEFDGQDSNCITNRKGKIIQFFNPWMFDAQRKIEAKKCVRSVIEALGIKPAPLVYEELPKSLKVCENLKHISLDKAVGLLKSLKKEAYSFSSEEIKSELDVVKDLVKRSYDALIAPHKKEIDKYQTKLKELD